jgi:hypothetical protein
MNAAQALLREVMREVPDHLSDDLTDAITEELAHADRRPRILPITAYRATRPTPTDGVEPDSPRGRYTYPPPDPRLRGLRFEAEEG